MQLDTSRFFSDKLVFDTRSESKLRLDSFSYGEEAARSAQAFKNFLSEQLGESRLNRITNRYDLNWEEMQRRPLLSRDIAKILIGTKCVTVEDVNERVGNFQNLSAERFHQVVQDLSKPFDHMWQVAEITDRISGRPTEWLSRIFFDPLLADRERLQIVKEHPTDTFDNFMHNMLARCIKRDLTVGTLIPAPSFGGKPQYYYVSAKLVTGKGMLSYIFHPATQDTNLKPIRLFRGTSPRNSELDAISTIITDFEKDLGMTAYRSGNIYEPIIQRGLGAPEIEGGHSLGSTVVQHRLVDMDHIRTAYLYCGPGITQEEIARFNQKNPQVHLLIRRAKNDPIDRVGGFHIGYNAPENVRVDFLQYRPKSKEVLDPHVTIWGKEPDHYEAEPFDLTEIDCELSRKDVMKEFFRSRLGPFLSCFLEWVRDIIRFFFPSRITIENGLKIGYMIGDRWQVDHFRAV